MAPARGGASLVRASLAIHHPPTSATGGLGGRIAQLNFQFNPQQLRLSRSASWQTQPAVSFERGALPEFAGAEPATLDIEILLDASASPRKSRVRQQVEQLLACCQVDPQSVQSRRPSPPWVRLSWGAFTTVQFVAHVDRVDATYTLFSPTGDPLRATCQVTLVEVPLATKRQNPTSGALTAQRTRQVVAGDSLASLAWHEYGDPAAWRAIADANGVDDPMRLATGVDLLLPAAEEVRRR